MEQLVDGVISQDSDCFAYGAIRVYRNFSVSTQGAQAAQGGAVDIYDMQQIKGKMGSCKCIYLSHQNIFHKQNLYIIPQISVKTKLL